MAITMNEQLLLKNIRNVMVRLEETIIFSLLERGQFRQNLVVYRVGAFGGTIRDDSLVGFMLHETERMHALLRRYTSPDENPFYDDLPDPILEALNFRENPLKPNDVNINDRIFHHYISAIVPDLCQAGDDGQYGSTALCDIACLQALSKRIHYGKFVAESKYLAAKTLYDELISAGDRGGLLEAITDDQVEDALLARIQTKASSFSSMLLDDKLAQAFPQTAVRIYADFVVPFTKDVEVEYLLA